eukprot:TRINITY_DN9684_c0_g1_i1.p1 TRINITY_DN9684_c0_g1~~TRINITY_DN9684_c0_g1_i1.p1  ORF type:complete len:222 (+),score=40.18 TRINITY_DN9684_c0_g1_i1:84-749(+)
MLTTQQLKGVWLGGQSLFLSCAVLSILPFGVGFQQNCNFYGFLGHIVAMCVTLFMTHGRPQFNMPYAQKVFTDLTGLSVFYDLIFLSFPGGLATFAPIIFYSILHTKNDLQRPITQYAPQFLKKYITDFYDLSARNQEEFIILSLRMEFYLVPYVVLMAFATGSILTPFLYYQYIKLKLQVSPAFQKAKASVGDDIRQLFHHQYCPAVITRVYETVRGYFS